MCESEEGFPSLKFPIPNKTGKIHLLKGLPPSTQRLFRILKLELVRLSFYNECGCLLLVVTIEPAAPSSVLLTGQLVPAEDTFPPLQLQGGGKKKAINCHLFFFKSAL